MGDLLRIYKQEREREREREKRFYVLRIRNFSASNSCCAAAVYKRGNGFTCSLIFLLDRPYSHVCMMIWWGGMGTTVQYYPSFGIRTYIPYMHCCWKVVVLYTTYVVLYYYINSSCSFLTSLGSCPYTYAHPPSLLLYSPSFVERGEREKKIKFQQKKKWSFSMRCEPFLSIVVVDTIYDDFCAGSGMSRISEKAVHVPVRLHRSTNRHHLLNPSSFLSPALDVRI